MRLQKNGAIKASYDISIHAPRMRCDEQIQQAKAKLAISIHAPRMRCDTKKQLNDILF